MGESWLHNSLLRVGRKRERESRCKAIISSVHEITVYEVYARLDGVYRLEEVVN